MTLFYRLVASNVANKNCGKRRGNRAFSGTSAMVKWKSHKYENSMTHFGACAVPVGERIVGVVPRGTELKLQLRWTVGQAAHTCNNAHIKCTGVSELLYQLLHIYKIYTLKH